MRIGFFRLPNRAESRFTRAFVRRPCRSRFPLEAASEFPTTDERIKILPCHFPFPPFPFSSSHAFAFLLTTDTPTFVPQGGQGHHWLAVPNLRPLRNISDLTSKYTDYLLSTTIETVDFALGHPSSCVLTLRPFVQLTLDVVRKSRIDTSVVLVALVYLERARAGLKISDRRWACERILIGALVLAAKVAVVPHSTHTTLT